MTELRLLLGGLLLSSLTSSLAFSATGGRMLTCRIPFDYASAEVDQEFVSQCIKNLKLNSRDTLQLVASATPQGGRAYNAALSQRRADNLKKAFIARVPGLEVQAVAIGSVPKNGLLAKATAPVNGIETTGTSGTTSMKAASPLSSGDWKVGPRIGRDRTLIEEKTQYFAPGFELAYTPKLTDPNLYLEFGALATTYTFVDSTKMNSIHFAPMIGYFNPSNGIIAGVRGLLGLVSSNVTQSELGDGGAEFRLGKETKNWTAFLGVGQTRVLQRVGFDLGYRF